MWIVEISDASIRVALRRSNHLVVRKWVEQRECYYLDSRMRTAEDTRADGLAAGGRNGTWYSYSQSDIT